MRIAAARSVPQGLVEQPTPYRPRLLSRPPSLGTMLQGDEEPPVAQHVNFMRPRSTFGGGSQSGDDGGGLARVMAGSPRIASSSSLLHDRIRSLQSQIASR
ncbi:hypothetical protein Micbo1qcDRAFT_160789, partial [Microdochium bolleyi]